MLNFASIVIFISLTRFFAVAWTVTQQISTLAPDDRGAVRKSSLPSSARLPRKTVLFASSKCPTVKGITLKIAVDSTGAAVDLAADKSERFTCPASLDLVHRLRCDSDAVLVGRKTIEVDNPSLTVRRGILCDRQPIRVVLDPLLKLIPNADDFVVFQDGLPTVVYHSVSDVDEALLNVQDSVMCVYVPDFDLSHIVQNLRSTFGVEHLMVEGGPVTARLFLPLLDRVIIIKAPLCFKEPLAAGLTTQALQDAGLTFLGKAACGVDSIEYWSKSDVPWPTSNLSDWP